jgi:hypothetical protein
MTAEKPDHLPWVRAAKPPICDVPWLGTAIVMSTGEVNFCCFSSSVVGNVNQTSFEKIWSGEEMQEIRRSLAAQRLPSQCQSTSCPIYRGDKYHYLVQRLQGNNNSTSAATHDPHLNTRTELGDSSIEILTASDGKLDVKLQYRGASLACDLFVALQTPDGSCHFLPDGVEYPVPLRTALELTEANDRLHFVMTAPRKYLQRSGAYQYYVALFEKDSNPNIWSNCYWSAVERFVVAG